MDLWAEKIGHKAYEDIGDRDAVRFGILLEAIVAKEFARRTGKKVRRMRKTRVHKKYDFMLANIDRDIVGERAGLECKTASAWLQQHWGDTGTDDLPLYYLTQCAHYMEVLDYDRWYCAVLIGGQEFRWYVIERSAEVAASLIEREAEFWRHVLSGTPPEATSFADMVTLYPAHTSPTVVATDAVFKTLSDLATLNATAKELESQQENLKMQVTEFMGSAGRLTDRAGTILATWLAHERTTIDAKQLKARHPEIYQELASTTIVRPFRI
jgi:putative phage-type endonuclease